MLTRLETVPEGQPEIEGRKGAQGARHALIQLGVSECPLEQLLPDGLHLPWYISENEVS